MHRLPDEPDCNVVDVQGDDGLFQHGKIVDCAQGGLVVDWDCNGYPSPQVVPFERTYRNIFVPQNCCEKDAVARGRTLVEVLLYRSDKEPRTWYPGILLAVFSDLGSHIGSFGLVQAEMPDGSVAVVARADRIRSPRSDFQLDQLRVQKDQFVKHSLRLPQGYIRGAASAQDIVHILNQRSGGPITRTRTLIRAVSMNDKTLDFIAVGNNFMPKSWRVPAKKAGGKLCSLLEEATKIYESRSKQLKRTFSEANLELSEQEGMPSDIPARTSKIQLLPRHILVGVLEYLDSAEQSRLRRVCAYWNCMLTLPCIKQVLRVSHSDKRQNYLAVASSHHAWTPHTKTIISAGFYCSRDVIMCTYFAAPLDCGGRLFRTLMQNGLHAPVERLVLSDVSLSLRVDHYDHELQKLSFSDAVGRFVEEMNGLACACQNLILRDVRVHVSCGVRARKFASICILTGRVAGCLTVNELWSRMDGSLPPLDHAQRQQVLTWIRSLPQEVLHILNDIQSCDPRDDANNYRNRVWTVDDLDGLEIDKLSKVTLHSLANLDAIQWKPTVKFVLSW